MGDYLDISLSPDGKHYAARVRQDESVYLVIVSLTNNEVVSGVRPGKDNSVARVQWVSNDRVVYAFAERRANLDSSRFTGELFAIDVDGKRNQMLAGFRASDERVGGRIHNRDSDKATHFVLNSLPDNKTQMLVIEHPWSQSGKYLIDDRSKYPKVHKMDIYTGKKSSKETIPFPGASLLADDQGKINFLTYTDKNDDVRGYFRKNKESDWTELSSVLNRDLKNLVAEGINRDGTKVYLYGRSSDEQPATLYEFELATQKLIKLFDNKVDLYAWELNENNEPYAGISYPNEVDYHYVANPDYEKEVSTHKSLVKAFEGRELYIASEAKDSGLKMLKVFNSVNPGEYYLYDTEAKKADFVWANYSWIDPRQMRPKEAIQLNARDGLTLHGYLTRPKSTSPAPLVVLPHGGPHGVRDFPSFDIEAQMLANRGYAVLQINFRGSGGYTLSFQKAGYMNWGLAMIDDIIDATKWAANLPYIDASNVCIYGASYGGYAAMMASIKAPTLYKCAVGYVGVYDLEAMITEGDIPKLYSGKGYLRRVLGSDLQALRDQSPVHLAHKLKTNILLIHGDEDRRVPSLHAKRLRKALIKHGNDPEWLYLGNVGHGAASLKTRMKVNKTLMKFLSKHTAKEKSS